MDSHGLRNTSIQRLGDEVAVREATAVFPVSAGGRSAKRRATEISRDRTTSRTKHVESRKNLENSSSSLLEPKEEGKMNFMTPAWNIIHTSTQPRLDKAVRRSSMP